MLQHPRRSDLVIPIGIPCWSVHIQMKQTRFVYRIQSDTGLYMNMHAKNLHSERKQVGQHFYLSFAQLSVSLQYSTSKTVTERISDSFSNYRLWWYFLSRTACCPVGMRELKGQESCTNRAACLLLILAETTGPTRRPRSLRAVLGWRAPRSGGRTAPSARSLSTSQWSQLPCIDNKEFGSVGGISWVCRWDAADPRCALGIPGPCAIIARLASAYGLRELVHVVKQSSLYLGSCSASYSAFLWFRNSVFHAECRVSVLGWLISKIYAKFKDARFLVRTMQLASQEEWYTWYVIVAMFARCHCSRCQWIPATVLEP